MIPLENLRPGDIAWYGNIEFSTGTVRAKNKYNITKVIITKVTGNRIYISALDTYDPGKTTLFYDKCISTWGYGKSLGSTLYKTEEEVVEDWNSSVYSALDLANRKYDRIQASIRNFKNILDSLS